MDLECNHCIVMDYRISRKMVDIQIDPQFQVFHRERLVFLTGKKMEHYPPIDETICFQKCGVIFQREQQETPK